MQGWLEVGEKKSIHFKRKQDYQKKKKRQKINLSTQWSILKDNEVEENTLLTYSFQRIKKLDGERKNPTPKTKGVKGKKLIICSPFPKTKELPSMS